MNGCLMITTTPTKKTIFFSRSYLLLWFVLLTLQICPQEFLQDFKPSHPPLSIQEQIKEFHRHNINNSIADTDSHFAFMHNKMLQEKSLSKTSRTHSEMYVVDTAVVRSRDYVVRIIYSYSQMGKVTEDLHQEWRNNQWENSFRVARAYDVYGNCLSEFHKNWKSTLWDNTELDLFTYDANGNRLTSASKRWLMNQWTVLDSTTFTYDTKGNLLSRLYQLWENSKWTNVNYSTSTYDDNGNELTNLFKSWKNDQWKDHHRTLYVHDEQGKQASSLYEEWKNNQWVNSYRVLFSYDADGNQILMVLEGWLNNQWTNSTHETSTFNTNGKKLTQLRGYWINNQWVNAERNTFSYDDNENQLMDIEEYWINDQWMNSTRYSFLYNQYNKLSEGYFEVWGSNAWVQNGADGSFNVDGVVQGSSYFNGYKITLSYKQIITDVSNEKEGIVKEYSLAQNFPNPFNPNTTIRYQISDIRHVIISIYNSLGEKVSTVVDEVIEPGKHEVVFDASKLSSGIYFYKITAGDFLQIKKMILIK